MLKTGAKVFVVLVLSLCGFSRPVAAEEPLPAEQAFKVTAMLRSSDTVIAEFLPAINHSLYKDMIRFSLENANGITIKQVQLPAGELHHDEFFGDREVYREPVQAEIALNRPSNVNTVTLRVRYQGCNEKLGICYPPKQQVFELNVP